MLVLCGMINAEKEFLTEFWEFSYPESVRGLCHCTLAINKGLIGLTWPCSDICIMLSKEGMSGYKSDEPRCVILSPYQELRRVQGSFHSPSSASQILRLQDAVPRDFAWLQGVSRLVITLIISIFGIYLWYEIFFEPLNHLQRRIVLKYKTSWSHL